MTQTTARTATPFRPSPPLSVRWLPEISKAYLGIRRRFPEMRPAVAWRTAMLGLGIYNGRLPARSSEPRRMP